MVLGLQELNLFSQLLDVALPAPQLVDFLSQLLDQHELTLQSQCCEPYLVPLLLRLFCGLVVDVALRNVLFGVEIASVPKGRAGGHFELNYNEGLKQEQGALVIIK